jgi:hypothetical protein
MPRAELVPKQLVSSYDVRDGNRLASRICNLVEVLPSFFWGGGFYTTGARHCPPPPLPRPPTNKLPTEKTTREVWLLGHGLHAQGVPVEDVHREFVRYELRRLVGGVVKNS